VPENRKLKVFLCHSKDDKPKVRDLYHRLVADGFDAWLDEEKLLPGQDWTTEIPKAVRTSDAVAICISKASVTKEGYVQKEIRIALDIADEKPDGTIFLIPVKLEDSGIPERLSKWQWVNLFDEKGYEKLKLSLVLRAQSLGLETFLEKHFDFEPQMIRVPAGKFLMGSTQAQATQAIKDGMNEEWVKDEQPQHEVDLSEYFISKYSIINQQYQVFIRETNYQPPKGWQNENYPASKRDHPIVNVSWDDAMEYCRWLSSKTGKLYRLPTEAEWEKAARGVDGRVYPWGNYFDKQYASASKGSGDTNRVGSVSPQSDSPYGCADMLGNIFEWCADWHNKDEYKEGNVKNPKGPKIGTTRVVRGGIYTLGQWSVRCAFRSASRSYIISDVCGFRVAISAVTL